MDYILLPTLERLDELLDKESTFLSGIEDQVRSMHARFIFLHSLLNNADASKLLDRDLIQRIIDIGQSAEDVVESYVFKSAAMAARSGAFHSLRHLTFKNEREEAKSKVEAIIVDLSYTHQRHPVQRLSELGAGAKKTASHKRKNGDQNRFYNITPLASHRLIGIDEKVEELTKSLVDEQQRIVVLCGDSGSGKTTLAKKVYNHVKVRCYFDHFAWVTIPSLASSEIRVSYMYEEVLHGLMSSTGKQWHETQDGKQHLVRINKLLQEKKCLVVVDEIGHGGILEKFERQLLFPLRSTSGSQFLLIGDKFTLMHLRNRGVNVHEPQYFNQNDIFQLIQTITRSSQHYEDYHVSLQNVSLTLAGLPINKPLTIMLIGGMLATKEPNEWSSFRSSDLNNYLNFCYLDLPSWLKPCLLYLSQLPEGHKISASKLTQLWIAEGFVSFRALDSKENGETLEDTAESYLNELISRFLISVGDRDASLQVTTCYLHNLVRYFCYSKAEDVSFHLHNYVTNVDTNFSPYFSSSRVAVHLTKHNFHFDSFHRSNLRSLLFFHDHKYGRWNLQKPVFDNLKLLRVLDLEGADLGNEELPKSIGELIHLRYLSLRHAKVLKISSALGNLRFLQTLDLLIEGGFVYIPDVIWKMNRLRHLYLPESCHTKTKLRLDTLVYLQTLVNFPTKNCKLTDIFVMTNLRELSIRDATSIKNFPRFSKSLGIKLKHLRKVSLDDSNKEGDKEVEDIDFIEELFGPKTE